VTDIEKGAYVYLEIRDGKLVASAGASSDEEEFERAATLHNEGEYVSLWMTFSVSEVLDGTIESFRHGNTAGVELDAEAKPRIDALRAELTAMISKIDAITYS